MRTTVKILVLLSFLLVFSCKKETVTEIINDNHFNVDLNVTNLVCFPYDSISLTFLMTATNGIEPYSYHWLNPKTLPGAGPFTINVKSDVYLDVEVSDARNIKEKYQCEIKKDTIDSLKYDYRNAYIGNYDCEVIYRWVNIDSGGVYHYYDTTYQDTVLVSKHKQFNMLKIENIPDLTYYPKYSGFMGYHTDVTFTNDSLDLYFFLTPVGFFNWTYKGRKLNK